MPASDNPIDFAAQVAGIPQVHISGAEDTVVPPSVAQRFSNATGAACTQVVTVPGKSHDSDWSRSWRELLKITPPCADAALKPATGTRPSPRSHVWIPR